MEAQLSSAEVRAKPDPSKTAHAIALMFGTSDCVTKLSALAHGSIASATAEGAMFRSAVEVDLSCLGTQWDKAYGISGAAATFITGIALWLADGIKQILDDLKALADSAVYWQGYRILLVSPVDWRNTSYTTTCGGVAQQPVTVTVTSGEGKGGHFIPGLPQSESYYEVSVLDVARGDLLGNGSSQTAVLLMCSPQPSNYFKTEIQVFGTGHQQLGTIVEPLTWALTGSITSLTSTISRSASAAASSIRVPPITGLRTLTPQDPRSNMP